MTADIRIDTPFITADNFYAKAYMYDDRPWFTINFGPGAPSLVLVDEDGLQIGEEIGRLILEGVAEARRLQQETDGDPRRRTVLAPPPADETGRAAAENAGAELAGVFAIGTQEGSGPVPPDAAGPGVMAAPFARAEDRGDDYGKEG